jgi:small-conductance mechanosensitive channel
MNLIKVFQNHTIQALMPVFILVLTFMLGLLVRRLVFSTLTRWARKTTGKIDDIVVRAINGPFLIWVLMLGIHFAAHVSPLPEKISNLVSKILLFLLIASVTAVCARLASEIIRVYGSRMQGTLPVTSLTQNLARLVVVTIGLLVLLNSFGISITPMLTALGVGGLAVALGLQDTLANFFAGFHVSLAGYVRLNDYIKLDSNEEGYVTDIGWRSTTIRALGNNLIIIPNSKLAQAIVTNYYLPEKRISFSLPVSVSMDADPAQIEKVLLEEAKKGAAEIPGLLADPEPVVRFVGFGSFSLDFNLVCHVSEFLLQYAVQHELRKRILGRFRREMIDIPLPARVVYVRSEPAKPESGKTGGRTGL